MTMKSYMNGAERIQDLKDFCKYGHVRQAEGRTGVNLGIQSTLETYKRTVKEVNK